MADCVRAWAPASISNLGPGFDCLGVAIEHWGDSIDARANATGHVTIEYSGSSVWSGARDWKSNTAGVAARSVLDLLGEKKGVDLVITKNIVPGSGVGSSAASAAAAAWAVNLLFNRPLSKIELIPAVLQGEKVASGTIHGDNALPSLFGGITISSTDNPEEFRQLTIVRQPFLSICLPHKQVNTLESRSNLPSEISLSTAIQRASSLALLVGAIQCGDWDAAGSQIMTDSLIEPTRAKSVPGYGEMKLRAINAGAFGFALSGSGPAVIAVSESQELAEIILREMIVGVESAGSSANGIISRIETLGARVA